MTRNQDISHTEAAQGQLSHINNLAPSPNLGGMRANCVKSGLQRMRVLGKAIHDLSNQANNTILYPTLAFHLLSPRTRGIGLQLLKQANPSLSPLAREVGWLRDEIQKGVQSRRRHKREVTGDPNGDKKTLKLLSKLFEKTGIPHIDAADLMGLPDAATKIGFNGSFSLLESFFALHLRLKPLFVEIQGPRASGETGEDLGACLNIAGSNGGDVDEQIRKGLARVVERLKKAAMPLKRLVLAQVERSSTTIEVSPATRFLGALTWDVWEENDLALFIDLLHKAERAEAHRMGGAAPNQQWHTPRKSRAELALEQAQKQRCPTGLTLVEWKRSLDPISAIREEISYCTWLLESMRQKGLVAVIVPSLEGVGFSCSKRALYAFWDLLRQELASSNATGGANSLWTKDCKNSQGHIVDGSWLLSRWGQSLDSVALAGLAQPLPPQEALNAFKKAVKGSNDAFYKRLQEAVEQFVRDLLICQCTLHGSIEDLVRTVMGANSTQSIAPEADAGGELADWESESWRMLTNTRSTLHNRLRRLGISEASISLVQGSDIVFSSFSTEIIGRGLGSATPEAVSTAARLRELHTFWISEAGQVTNLYPRKSSKGGGTWKKQFLNYLSHGSAKFVAWELEMFCRSRRRR